jgi:DNA-binding FadR family transcriptional regulator
MEDRSPPGAPLRFEPQPVNVRGAADQIAEQLRGAITEGTYSAGERLPSEADMAERFGVSRGTIREALRLLAASNLVRSARGAMGGTFVTLPEPETVAEQIGDLIALWFRAGNVSLAEVDYARNVIERECVRLAAEHRTEDDLAAMRRAVEDSRQPGLLLDEWLAMDLEFHVAISRAAKNSVLEFAMTAIHMVRPRTNTLLNEVLRPEPISEQHWTIYEAIRDRLPEQAVAAFAVHFDYLAEVQRTALADRDAKELTISDIAPEHHPAPDVLRRRRELYGGAG